MRTNLDEPLSAQPPAGAPASEPHISGTVLAVLILISTTTPIAMNMYLPALPAIQQDFGTSTAVVQLSLSLFLVATAVGQLVAGPLSDIFGRRPVLTWGLSLFVIASIICTLAPSPAVLIIGRMLQGFGGCTGMVLSRAIVRDIFGTATAASMIGYVTMGIAVAPLLTPTLGGFIYEVSSWRFIFLFMCITGVFSVLAMRLKLPESHPPVRQPDVFGRWRREVGELLRIPTFWSLALTLAFLCVAFFTFVAGGTVVAVEVYELGASEYGMFFVFMVSGYIVGNFVTGRYSRRIGLTRMIVMGNIIALVGVSLAVLLALTVPSHPFALFGPMLVVGMGNGLSLPNCVAGSVSVRPDLAGTASGLSGAFQIGSGALASFAVGIMIDLDIWDDVRWPVLLLMLAGAVAAFITSLTIDARKLSA
ncbi:MAG: multidrug effflux MFS transporter [Acuticoccus sp.]